MKVMIDAGHGGGSGACGGGFVEDRLNLEMAIRIGHYLRLAGVGTCMTRLSDENIPITARVCMAKARRCEMLVSIHFNASYTNARGAECFVVPDDERSMELAGRILQQVSKLGLPVRGIKEDSQSAHSRLGILRGVYRKMPAVLIEAGFLTSEQDAELLRNRMFRDDLAKAISRGILADRG